MARTTLVAAGPILLAALVLGLVALTALPAHALEKKVFGNVVVEPGESESEVSTAIGDITVEGVVEGDVRSARGDVEVGRGDVELGPGATVVGDLHYGSGEVDGNWDAVQGTMRGGVMGPGMDHDWGGFGILNLVGWAFAAALFPACSVLAVVLAPGQVSAATRRAEESPGMSLLFGVASVPAVVVLCVVLAVSIIGIPLLLLLAPAYLALVFFGALVAPYIVGRRVVFATGRYHVGNAMAAAVGALILAAAYLIPLLGGLLVYGLTLFGTGASVLALVSRRRSRTYPSYEAYVDDRRDA